MSTHIDLTGRSIGWPSDAQRLWLAASAEATASTETWTNAPLAGDPELRAELASWTGHNPDHLAVTAGVRAFALTVARVAPRVLVEHPTYPTVPRLFTALGAQVRRAEWHDLESFRDECDALWVTTPARNPDGASVDRALADVIAAFARRGVMVVQDEACRWFEGDRLRIAGAVTVGTLSKLTGSGARIGWATFPDVAALAEPELRAAAPPYPWQRAWATFLRRGGGLLLEDMATLSSAAARTFRTALAESPGSALELESGGPFVLVRLPRGSCERDAVRSLAAAGVLSTSGEDLALEGPAVRFCFAGVSSAAAEHCARVVHTWVPVLGMAPRAN